jgi:tRNA G10  N-methylase Trm11
MLVDILNFASVMLVENGRLSMWMPTANDEEQELEIPQHGALELMSECIQPFNKCKTPFSRQSAMLILVQGLVGCLLIVANALQRSPSYQYLWSSLRLAITPTT